MWERAGEAVAQNTTTGHAKRWTCSRGDTIMMPEASPELADRLNHLENTVSQLHGLVNALVRVSPLPPSASLCSEADKETISDQELQRTRGSDTAPLDEKWQHDTGRYPHVELDPETLHFAMLGRLLTGVTHDINNLLSIICGYAELLAEDFQESDPQYENAIAVAQLGHQAADLVRYLNNLKVGTQRSSTTSLNDSLNPLCRLLPRYVGSQLHFSSSLGSETQNVPLIPAEILQVVLNLVGNARNHTSPNGMISLRTASYTFQEKRYGWPDVVPPGKYALIAVTDSGSGMTEEVRLRIFEPGFTTRAGHGGTGLGLQIVREIVDRAHGYIQVQTVVEWGTTIRIFLPQVP